MSIGLVMQSNLPFGMKSPNGLSDLLLKRNMWTSTATVDKFYMFRAIFHPVRRYSLAGGLVLMCRKLV